MKVNFGALQIEADDFEHATPMPEQFSVDGAGGSPALSWSGVPDGTSSFALVVHDPDAPVIDGFTHWVLYGIPADVTSLAEGAPSDLFVGGRNSMGEPGWRPAAPPPGHGTHHYFFHLYALDDGLAELPSGLTAAELLQRIDPHVIHQARIVGTYRREP